MRYAMRDKISNEAGLLTRILRVVLFVTGGSRLSAFSRTIGYLSHAGLPFPRLVAAVVAPTEFFAARRSRPASARGRSPCCLALYTLGKAPSGTTLDHGRRWADSQHDQFPRRLDHRRAAAVARHRCARCSLDRR